MLSHEIKVRGDVKLQFRAIKRSNNVHGRRLQQFEKWNIFDVIFFLTHYVREKRNDRGKIEKTC